MADKKSASKPASSAKSASSAKEKPKAMNKSTLLAKLAETTELSRQQVTAVLEALAELVKEELGKKGPGEFTVPGLLKLRVERKPAQPEQVKPNPFKPGEMMTVKAKPERKAVKARILKAFEAELA